MSGIHEFARIGIVHFMLWKDAMRGDGDYRSLDLLMADPELDLIEITAINDDAIRAEVARKTARSGQAVAFAAQPVLLTRQLDLNHIDENERQKAVRALLAVIPQARELQACGFAVLSGKNPPPRYKDKAMGQLLRSLGELAAALKSQAGIPLVLEVFDQLEYAKNCLIGDNRDAAEIAREMRKKYPDFGLLIDLSHIPLQNSGPAEVWETCGEYVVHAHMGNCIKDQPGHPMNGDEHPPFCDPAGENGVEELAEYLRVLKQGGYLDRHRRPPLSFEVCAYGELGPQQVLQDARQVLAEAWQIVS